MVQRELFASAGASPEGFTYSADFLSAAEERELLGAIGGLALAPAQYKEWHARRRVVAFGGSYDFSRHELKAAPPIPDFLQGLRERVAHWGGVAAGRIEHAMIAEYPPGSPLGWHRDVPQFEDVFGVSLLGHARLRLRPWPPRPGERTAYALELEPRSAYALRGAVRWQWQHAISPTRELRYSITFRTRRA